MKRSALLPVVSIICAIALPGRGVAQAQDFPNRPVTIINQTAPGSGPDVICRILADQLSRVWRQQALVHNRQGAAGVIAAQAAAKAPADGYTLYMPTSTALVIVPEITPNLPVDFARDFVPLGLVAETPMAIAIAANLGINSLEELIRAAKAKPDAFMYVANNRGSVPHLAGAYLSKRAGITLTFVPHSGAPGALHEVMGGRIPIIIESLSALAGGRQSGAIKVLAVTSPARLPQFPDLPTVAETIPGFVVTAWFALLAPAGTPEPIAQKIVSDLASVLSNAEVVQKFEALGVYALKASPSATRDFIRRERETWRPVIAEAGLGSQ